MDAKEKTKKHFDETAADYNKSSDGRFVQPMYQALVGEIERCGGEDLLDIDCGNGNLFRLLSESTYRFCGIDISNNMIAQAKETYGELAELTVADAEKIPFRDMEFGILVCNASFHHYTHPDIVLDEMNRVAKHGCTLLIGDPYAPQPFRGLANVFTKYFDEGDYHYYGIREMQKLLVAHGFVLTQSKRTGNHTILHIAKKNKSR